MFLIVGLILTALVVVMFLLGRTLGDNKER